MHCDEPNPLEVLADTAAAIQQERSNPAAATTSPSSTSSDNPHATTSSAEDTTAAEEDEEDVVATSQEEQKTKNTDTNMVAPLMSESVNSKPLALQSPLLGSTIRAVTPLGGDSTRHTKYVMSNKDSKSKTLTFVKMKGVNNKQLSQGAEHAYAYLSQVDGGLTKAGKTPDDDEGYCSRSSLDSPGQSSRSDSDAFEQEVSLFESQKSPGIRGGPMSPPPPRVTSPRPQLPSTGFVAPRSVKKPSAVPLTPRATPQKVVVISRDQSKVKTPSSSNNAVLKKSLVEEKNCEQEIVSEVKTDSTIVNTSALSTSSTSALTSTPSSSSSSSMSITSTSDATKSTVVSTSTSSPILSTSVTMETKTVTSIVSTPEQQKEKEESTGTEDQEEDVDVTTCTAPMDTSEMLNSASSQSTISLPSLITRPSGVSLSSSSSVPFTTSSSSISSVATAAVPPRIIDSLTKRVPLLINTSLGHKVTSAGGPVTYLLVPPPVSSSVKGVNVATTGGVMLGAKNQYIIQDDFPPSTKLNNGGIELGARIAIADNARTIISSSKAPAHAKPVSLLSKPAKASGALVCIDANTGRPVFTANSPSQLGLFASKMAPSSSSSSVSSSSSSQLSTSTSAPCSTSSSSSTSSSTTLYSLENPDKQINIKISGSKVIDMASLQEITPGTVGKKPAATSIGNIGSLSLTKVDNASVSPRTVSPLSRTVSPQSLSAGSSFSPIGSVAAGSRSHTPLSMGGGDGAVSLFGPPELDQLSPGFLGTTHSTKSNMSARTCHTYVKRKNSAGELSSSSQKSGAGVDVGGMRLHPLIDHDYCMFTEFSADIQSSIIATTESKLKTERKYSKKTKAARCTKVLRIPAPDKAPGRKKRKYTRRIPLEKLRQQRSMESTTLSIPSPSSVDSMDIGSPESGLSSPPPLTPVLKPESPGPKSVGSGLDGKGVSNKPKTPTKRRDSRNYVKITGSYQDEFVYFATKKTSGRPRKYHDSVVSQASTESTDGEQKHPQERPPPGHIDFDWYRDLSYTDKSTRFGMESDKLHVPTDSSSILASRTPEHDSEVVDLVMEMDHDNTVYSESHMEKFNSFADSNSIQYETVITTPSDESKTLLGSPSLPDIRTEEKTENSEIDVKPKVELDASTPVTSAASALTNEHPVIDDAMMEEVRTMLISMDEAELKMLEENLSEASKNTTVKSGSTDHQGLNTFLGSYNTDCGGPSQGSAGAFDFDDIADSDLLPMTELPLSTEDLPAKHTVEKNRSELNMLFSDTCSRSAAESPLKQFTSMEEKHEAAAAAPENFTDKLDRSELFPDITTPQPQTQAVATTAGAATTASSAAVTPQCSNSMAGNCSPPELTTVSMYWNDLPGLMLHGKQHVRLVDIHKQMLPAKDTGILKKRCQMMRLELVHCSDLQRDFLVRYAHAAKSKSTVLVSKEDAMALVSFYVDPRPRAPRLPSHNMYEATEPIPDGPGSKQEMGGKLKLKMKLKAEDLKQEVNGSADDNTSPPPPITGGKTKRVKRRAPSLQADDDDESKRSGRTRNKKVNYAALHSGSYEDGAKPLPVAESSSSEHNTTFSLTDWPETAEIEMLVEKRKRQAGRLSKTDTDKLKVLKCKVEERIRRAEQTRSSLLKQKKSKTLPINDSDETKKAEPSATIVEDVAATEFIEVVSPGPPAELLVTEGSSEPEPSPVTPVTEDLNVEDEVEAEADVEECDPPAGQEVPAIIVHHRDNTSRSSTQQRNRWQEGYLKLSLYSSKDSPCITCNTCRETFSVKKFIKHLHHQNKADELCEVTLVQKLEPKCPAPMLTWQIWEQFEKRRAQFEEIALKEKQVLKLQRQEQNSTNPPSQRASGRARKRKQLHPMESYVYADHANKRPRFADTETGNATTEHVTMETEVDNSITPKDCTNMEKVR